MPCLGRGPPNLGFSGFGTRKVSKHTDKQSKRLTGSAGCCAIATAIAAARAAAATRNRLKATQTRAQSNADAARRDSSSSDSRAFAYIPEKRLDIARVVVWCGGTAVAFGVNSELSL